MPHHCTYLGVSSHNFQKYSILVPKNLFYRYSVDPDEMQHYTAFHQGLHCLQKYSFRGSRIVVVVLSTSVIRNLPLVLEVPGSILARGEDNFRV